MYVWSEVISRPWRSTAALKLWHILYFSLCGFLLFVITLITSLFFTIKYCYMKYSLVLKIILTLPHKSLVLSTRKKINLWLTALFFSEYFSCSLIAHTSLWNSRCLKLWNFISGFILWVWQGTKLKFQMFQLATYLSFLSVSPYVVQKEKHITIDCYKCRRTKQNQIADH